MIRHFHHAVRTLSACSQCFPRLVLPFVRRLGCHNCSEVCFCFVFHVVLLVSFSIVQHFCRSLRRTRAFICGRFCCNIFAVATVKSAECYQKPPLQHRVALHQQRGDGYTFSNCRMTAGTLGTLPTPNPALRVTFWAVAPVGPKSILPLPWNRCSPAPKSWKM